MFILWDRWDEWDKWDKWEIPIKRSAPINPIKRSVPIYPIKRAKGQKGSERVLKGRKGIFSAPLDTLDTLDP